MSTHTDRDWLIDCVVFTSQYDNFDSYGDVAITGEALQNVCLCLACMGTHSGTIGRVLYLATPAVIRGLVCFVVTCISEGLSHFVALRQLLDSEVLS